MPTASGQYLMVPPVRTGVDTITSEDLIEVCDYWGIQERDRV